MTSQKKCVLTACLVMLLSACGQRGPLYLPEEPPANQTQEASDTADSEQNLQGEQ
uniref:LPS translocon maturation chaperone LptM n=1 Tax=Ningiella ruwaisensis TaxID=2364274 RepID=UPI00109F52FC|nr:lipoprotein [Ningiella ruwaisensis]